jgi:hypothetical protein
MCSNGTAASEYGTTEPVDSPANEAQETSKGPIVGDLAAASNPNKPLQGITSTAESSTELEDHALDNTPRRFRGSHALAFVIISGALLAAAALIVSTMHVKHGSW